MMSDRMPLYPAKTIAKILNLTERRVQQLAKDGVIPKAERGKYDLVGSVRGYVKYLQDRALGNEATPTDLQTEKWRLIKAQADEKELQVEQLRGSLILRTEVLEYWQSMLASMRARLLSIPSRSAPIIITASTVSDVEQVLTLHVHEALAELASDGAPNGSGASG